MAPSLELGGIGGVERGGSDGPLSLMLVLGTLLGFQGIPLSVATVGRDGVFRSSRTDQP